MHNTPPPLQQPGYSGATPPQNVKPSKRLNYVGMIGLGLILLSACLILIAPEIAIYSGFFGMIFSFAGLAFKPRWIAAIGAVLSSIVIIIIILLIVVISNPGPPGPNSRINGAYPDEEVADDDSLLLEEVEVDEIAVTDSAAMMQPGQ